MDEPIPGLGRDISEAADAVFDLGIAHGTGAVLADSDLGDLAPDINALRTDGARLAVVVEKLAAVSDEFPELVAGKALRRSGKFSDQTVNDPGGVWFVARMIEDGSRLARARQSTTEPDFRQAIAESVSATVAALSTGTTELTYYIGLVGISLNGVASTDVGIGELRHLTDVETIAFSAGQPTDANRLCLVIKDRCRWDILDAASAHSNTEPSRPVQLDPVLRLGTLLCLAGARNKHGELRTPQSVWSRTSPYFFQGGSMSYGANPDLQWRTQSEVFDVILAANDAEHCRTVAAKLNDLNIPLLHTFLPRLVRASQVYNTSDEERLIDAAVAWETLFGSQDRDQLALQLRLAMSWLLEPNDPAKRLELFKNCKKIYELRSAIVHGSPLKPAQRQRVKDSANDLLELLRMALSTMIRSYPQLPAATRSYPQLLKAKDRTTPIILQIPG